MSTAHSPLSKLKAEANRMAAILKATDRGENDHNPTIAAARKKDRIVFAVAMDDKILKITMPWTDIKASSEAALSEFILKHMRESRDTVQ